MNKLKKRLGKISEKSSIINTVVGILLVFAMIIIYQKPNSRFAILTACTAAGILYMMFGVNMWKDPKKKMTAMSYVMMGAFLMVLGLYLFNIFR